MRGPARTRRGIKSVVPPLSVLVAAIALQWGTGAGTAQAQSAAPRYYLAMGASLVTGAGSTGGADYVNDLAAYAQPLIPGLQVENLGCGGETTTTMLHGGRCTGYSTGSQLGDAEAFLTSHPGQVAFVTIDIGGDDVLGCASGTTINLACFDNGLANIEANLPQIMSGLRSAGGSVPIVALTYYDPFLALWLDGPAGQSAAHESVRLLGQLNTTLRSIYQQYGAVIANGQKTFGSSDFEHTGTWEGQTLPANVATICNWTLMCSSGGTNVHTNDTGYAELASTFEKVLRVPPTLSGVPPSATVGSPYSFQFAVTGIPQAKVRHDGRLPAGLTLSTGGLLAGTPTRAGTYPVVITAANGGGRQTSEPVTLDVS